MVAIRLRLGLAVNTPLDDPKDYLVIQLKGKLPIIVEKALVDLFSLPRKKDDW
jgi:hypothetical protein